MPQETPQIVSFHFHKTAGFQTLHADGVVGSTTPAGYGFLAFFTERAPMPVRVDQELKKDGSLGDVLSVDCKEGVFREIHTGVTMELSGLELLRERVDVLIRELAGGSGS